MWGSHREEGRVWTTQPGCHSVGPLFSWHLATSRNVHLPCQALSLCDPPDKERAQERGCGRENKERQKVEMTMKNDREQHNKRRESEKWRESEKGEGKELKLIERVEKH